MEDKGRFIRYSECQYFPCHSGLEEEDFNCKFCYCPLYTLGDECGGNAGWIDAGGQLIKDCSACILPHKPDAANYIDSKFSILAQLAADHHKK
ncbi:MAG: metal-binding protein [Firmicutes bacterium]|nr:metal-binding protein [Bacillota bacterium]